MKLNAEDGGHHQCILVNNNGNRICENVTYERNKRVIEGYTSPNGEHVEGLHGNNLRYYKTDFVDRERTVKNMRALVDAAPDMLCIKEDMYIEVDSFCTLAKLSNFGIRHFTNGCGKDMLVIYDETIIPDLVDIIYNMEMPKPIKIYVFSTNNKFIDKFNRVKEKINFCDLPAPIYNAYRNIILN